MPSPRNQSRLIALGLMVGFLGLYWHNLQAVPFHPDESTQIFMSRDFVRLFLDHDLANFAWLPGQPGTLEVQYRLLDAPLPKYLIGLGWWLAGYTVDDLNDDWEWRFVWADNIATHRLPDPAVLWAARMPSATLAALSTVLLFWIGRRARNTGVGLATAVLWGFNALNLLHSRRAMAESTALFFAILSVWMMMRWYRDLSTFTGLTRKWIGKSVLIGIGIGLAVSGKQTGLALWPVALVIVGLTLGRRYWPEALALGGTVTLSCGLLFWTLNPILYRSPLVVAQAMVEARAALVQRQIADTEALFPQALTLTPMARLQATLLELYLRPLAFSDIPIYTKELAPSIKAYNQQWIGLWRHPGWGALSLGFTLIGLFFSGLRVARLRHISAEVVCWLWGGATLALILVAIPLDWQRYFLPLAPITTLFTALGLEALILPFWRTRAIMKPSGEPHEIRHHHQ